MNTIISCKQDKRGLHSFYVNFCGKDYYLFSQNYHTGVNKYFSSGVSLHKVFDMKTAKKNHCIIKTITKVRPYIKYIEKEYGLKILEETKNKDLNKGFYNHRNDYKNSKYIDYCLDC